MHQTSLFDLIFFFFFFFFFFAGVQSVSQVSIPDVNVEPNPANVSSETNINCTWKEDFELLSANISMWVQPDYESAYMATDENSLANVK